jgi:hypothetical protein
MAKAIRVRNVIGSSEISQPTVGACEVAMETSGEREQCVAAEHLQRGRHGGSGAVFGVA